jgi:hypothetical protein
MKSNDIEDDAGFQRLAQDVARGVYASDPEFFLKDLKALIGDTVKRKAKKIQVEEALRRSDLTARLAEREDIEHGHHDGIPRGEHVANLRGSTAND